MIIVFPEEYELQKSSLELPICYYESYFEYIDDLDTKTNNYSGNLDCVVDEDFPNILYIDFISSGTVMPLFQIDWSSFLNLDNTLRIYNLRNPLIAGSYEITLFLLEN